MDLTYRSDRTLRPAQFVDLLQRSGLAARRPVDDAACIEAMLAHADLLVTAWDGERLVGVARSVTDFSYCCYLSDLAVDRALQRSGVGLRLQQETQARLGPRCTLILLAAPAARDYYPRVGYSPHDSCWVLPREARLGTGAGD